MVDISVIIPVYNRAGLIVETLKSLFNQTAPAKEIIVVDDGSTDGTSEAVEREFSVFSEQFSGNSKSNIQNPTFKILRQANAGPGAARNRGLSEATGEFIHFFDSDDIAAPNKHEVQLRALLETGADIAYGPWVKGRFEPAKAQTVACGELSVASFNSGNTRYQLPSTLYSGFIPEGPVLQARGLPDGDLVKALLTNWSVVPHACLFRRSILEMVGGFPEDLFGTEDQLMFLRCLLAGAKVVHSPGTMEFYRVGDPSKITATGAAQKRHAIEWAKFLLKASEEVRSDEGRVTSEGIRFPAEALGRGEGKFSNNLTTIEHRGEGVGTSESKDTVKTEGEVALLLASQSGASESDSLASELAVSPVSESLTRSAIGPASPPATRNPLLVTTTPSAWFGFRLRAYEAWRDLRAFFPEEYQDFESGLEKIWKRNRSSFFIFHFSVSLLRIWGGLKLRVVGHRWSRVFRTESCNRSKWFV